MGGQFALHSQYIFPTSRSIHSNRRIQSFQKRRVTERLEEKSHSAMVEGMVAHTGVPLRGDKDDRNLLSAENQFPLQIEPRHAWHGNVKDQAAGQADTPRCQELLRR